MKNSSLLTYRGRRLSFCHLSGPVLLFSCPKIMSLTEPRRYFVHSHIRTRKKWRIFPYDHFLTNKKILISVVLHETVSVKDFSQIRIRLSYFPSGTF